MEYGLYNWWPKQNRPDNEMDELFDGMVHPDDIQLANEVNPMGKVFIKTGCDQDYIIIEFGEYKLRVTPENWKPVIGDGFKIGDIVRVLSKSGRNTPKQGTIISMSWHHKNNSIVYHVSENGNRLKKQYFASDFEPS